MTEEKEATNIGSNGESLPTPPPAGPAWDKVGWWSKRKLQAAHLLKIMLPPVNMDMAEHPILFAISAIPGPNPTSLLVMLSYLVRRDQRAKDVRSQMSDLFRKGAPTGEYAETLYLDEKRGVYVVDNLKLAQKKAIFVKDLTIETGKTAFKTIGGYYEASKKWSKGALTGAFTFCAKPFMSEQKQEKTLSAIFNAAGKGEQAVGAAAQFTGNAIGAGWRALSSLWRKQEPPAPPPPAPPSGGPTASPPPP